MHLLISFASTLSETGRHTLRQLQLPNLTKLLSRLSPSDPIGTDEYSLTPPHERALARTLGWQAEDGCLPWAARAAAQDGIDVGDQAWGLLSPVHWHVGTDHVSLADPLALHLSAQESRTLFETIRPLFETEGWNVAWAGPNRWYAAHDSLAGLPTASLDRVIGRSIDLWMPANAQASKLRRLQNEAQMLLYRQPLNDVRVGMGALPVNSFWLSGCGRVQPCIEPAGLIVDNSLRAPVLSGDWVAWGKAWEALDAGRLRDALTRSDRKQALAVTLCGERHAQSFVALPRSFWSRISTSFRPPAIAALLEAL
ncbi:MAG TPA: hypothetical protein VE029_08815 [Rhizobacter sp.]|nr:hypothetical protein [Rhizobacter sp.]